MTNGPTLTERRISSAARAVLDQVESAYEQVFPGERADDQFFDELDAAHADYQRRTAQRPITPTEVKTAQRIFRDKCRTVMQEAKNRERSRRDTG